MAFDRDRLMAFFMAAAITIIIVGTLIVIHEVDSDLKDVLDSITGHHWLTKSVLVIVLFPLLSAAFYLLFGREGVKKRIGNNRIIGWTLIVVAATLIFVLGSFLYYALHYLGAL